MGKNKDTDKQKNQAPTTGETATAVLEEETKVSKLIGKLLATVSEALVLHIFDLWFLRYFIQNPIAWIFCIPLLIVVNHLIDEHQGNWGRTALTILIVILLIVNLLSSGATLLYYISKVQFSFSVHNQIDYSRFPLLVIAVSTSVGAASIIISLASRLSLMKPEEVKTHKHILILASIIVILSCIDVFLLSYELDNSIIMKPFEGNPEAQKFERLSDSEYDKDEMDRLVEYLVENVGNSVIKYRPRNVIEEGGNPWIAVGKFSEMEEKPYITLQLKTMEKIQIIGFWPGGSAITDNKPFPTRVRFDFSDGSSAEYKFKSKDQLQRVKLSRPVETSYVKITVLDIWPKHGVTEEVCIQHVQLWRVGENQ